MQHVGPSTWHLLDHYSPTRYLSGALFKPRPGPWPSRLHRTSPLYRRGDFSCLHLFKPGRNTENHNCFAQLLKSTTGHCFFLPKFLQALGKTQLFHCKQM